MPPDERVMTLQLLVKGGRLPDQFTVDISGYDEDDAFSRIRCPLCQWRPSASSRWCCHAAGTPEPFFEACGTTWNTFATRGLCPGCGHQWQWTSCLRCSEWSRHADWYDEHRTGDDR
jgi:hypothetical protein